MYPTLLNKQQYALLGFLLLKQKPDVANELLEDYMPKREAPESDILKIEQFYQRFCQLKGLDAEEIRGPLYKTSKVEIRRQFIAAILHLYIPYVYDQPDEYIMIGKSGVAKKLSDVFCITKASITTMIREVIFFEKQYQDFSELVASIIKEMTHAE
jgi:hypothetical protein